MLMGGDEGAWTRVSGAEDGREDWREYGCVRCGEEVGVRAASVGPTYGSVDVSKEGSVGSSAAYLGRVLPADPGRVTLGGPYIEDKRRVTLD